MSVVNHQAKGNEATKCYLGEINGQNTCYLDGIIYNPDEIETTISSRTNPKVSESIERIEITNSDIACIPTEIFLVFKNLKTLVISDGNKNLNSLKPNNFIGANNLEVLQLNNNNIPSLVPSNFMKARGLKNLDLSRNRITDVKPHTFTGLDQLQKLNLNDNQIETLKSFSLMGLFSLKELRLSNNKIKKIEFQALRYNKKLLMITFKGNRCINVNFVPYKFPGNEQDVYGICEGKQTTKKPKQITIRIQEVPLKEKTPVGSNYHEMRQAPEGRVKPPGHHALSVKPVKQVRPVKPEKPVKRPTYTPITPSTQDDGLNYNRQATPVQKDGYFQENHVQSALAKAQASIKRFEDLKLDKPFYYLELDNFHKIEEPPAINLR